MIEYNIHYTKDKNGKRIARQQYYAADGTKKYIQAKTATALKQKLEEKFKNRPLVKFGKESIRALFEKRIEKYQSLRHILSISSEDNLYTAVLNALEINK